MRRLPSGPGGADDTFEVRYYFAFRYRRVVLPLHSLELLAVLTLLAERRPHPALLGYVLGAWLHLVLDIIVNGEQLIMRPLLFYSLLYRARHRFAADTLLAPLSISRSAGTRPIREFLYFRLAG
jgi:hypothetical protein